MCACWLGECRAKNPDCENGKYIYRCGNLNCRTEKIYQNAIQKVKQYDFGKLKLEFKPRSHWDFYKERVKKEDNGTACDGCRGKITEAFECRCAYLCTRGKCKEGKKWGGSKYEILYYQLPVSDDYNGKVDLVLREVGTNEIYLTEYKPARTKSPERLLRMICEIVTYRQSSDKGCIKFFNNMFKGETLEITENNIHTAIMFNEFGDGGDDGKNSPQNVKPSPQKNEYDNSDEGIKELLKTHHVNVFMLKKDKEIVLLESNS